MRTASWSERNKHYRRLVYGLPGEPIEARRLAVTNWMMRKFGSIHSLESLSIHEIQEIRSQPDWKAASLPVRGPYVINAME